jgi:putative redox protein
MKTEVIWEGKMAFSAVGPSGYPIQMDASKELGGDNAAARPMELILHGLGGCTAIDILMILQKMRLTVESFQLQIQGTRAEVHPKRYTAIHLYYILEGPLPAEKVRRAITLSIDKYCSVSKSLNAEITASFAINGEKFI